MPKTPPNRTPYLRFGEAERPILGPAVEIVGNAKALLQLRKQRDRALEETDTFPFDDTIYRDDYEQEHQVVVRRAKSREEMRPPASRAEKKAPERLPWAEAARRQGEEREQKLREES